MANLFRMHDGGCYQVTDAQGDCVAGSQALMFFVSIHGSGLRYVQPDPNPLTPEDVQQNRGGGCCRSATVVRSVVAAFAVLPDGAIGECSRHAR